MKIFTSQRLLFTLILSSMGFMAVGCDRFTSSNQYKTETSTGQQQGYGRAPQPPSTNLQTRTGQQQGHGRAPQPPSTNQTRTRQQQGYGRAPQSPINSK